MLLFFRTNHLQIREYMSVLADVRQCMHVCINSTVHVSNMCTHINRQSSIQNYNHLDKHNRQYISDQRAKPRELHMPKEASRAWAGRALPDAA